MKIIFLLSRKPFAFIAKNKKLTGLYIIYTLASKKYLQSRLPDFNYERDFGGVLYLFIRGIRKGNSNGIFNCKPSLDQIDLLDRMFSQKSMVQPGSFVNGELSVI